MRINIPANTDRLTAISVAGFKSIAREQTLSIAPLTILAGANSSGKSSMMQPLLLMKQTLEAPYDPGVFLLDGPNVRFTSSKQMLSFPYKLFSKRSFGVTFEAGERKSQFIYSQTISKNFRVQESFFSNHNCRNVRFAEGMGNDDFLASLKCLYPKTTDSFLGNKIIDYFYDRCFLDVLVLMASDGEKSIPKDTVSNLAYSISEIKKEILSTIHIPGLRGNPERTYKTSGIGKKFSGTFENYVASIVYLWQQYDNSKITALTDQLIYIGLASSIDASALDATQVEIKVGRLPASTKAGTPDLVNIADVGVGVSQTLPVLVALLAAEPGQIVYIEQPEIHLHPLAQYKLAAVIAEASKRGVLVIIETHSDILIRGVQTLVAKGELDPAIVKLHWFSRSPEDGSTTVTCAELDENGAFGDWPQDFDTTALDAEKAYLDAVEARLDRHEK